MPTRLLRSITLPIMFVAAVAPAASAQGVFGRLKDKAKAKVAARTDKIADSTMDQALKAGEKSIRCAVSDEACIEKAKASGKAIVVVDGQGKPVSSADSARAVGGGSAQTAATNGGAAMQAGAAAGSDAAPPGTGVWLNYDFVPGDRVLYYDDFADDNVGDLPKHEDIEEGNVSVVKIDAKQYLRTENGTRFELVLPEALPQRFTIEATFHNAGGNGGRGLHFTIGGDGRTLDYDCHLPEERVEIQGTGPNGHKDSQQETGKSDTQFGHCQLMVDGGYAKGYIDGKRLAQLNGLQFDRTNRIRVEVPGGDEKRGASLVTEIRVAEGGKKLWDALSSTGRVSTHGILFDTGSDRIRGESTPTLKEIGDMLTEHPELKLTIEGHTDDVGSATDNQTLSEKRAAAVKSFLVATYHVDAARLATRGFGASKPVAPNTTPAGRQQNRRVELVKM